MNAGEIVDDGDGLWSTFIWAGRTADLVSAFDPDGGPVVFEGYAPAPRGWSAQTVPLTADRTSNCEVTVRNLRFDLMLPATDLRARATELDLDGLYAWQGLGQPPHLLQLLQKEGAALQAAIRGTAVSLLLDQTFAGEPCRLTSVSRDVLSAALDRLRNGL